MRVGGTALVVPGFGSVEVVDDPYAAPKKKKPDPLLRNGIRPLYGVEELDILKMQVRVTAMAAARTYTKLDTLPDTEELPPPERLKMRKKT